MLKGRNQSLWFNTRGVGAENFAWLTSSRVICTLEGWGLLFENHCSKGVVCPPRAPAWALLLEGGEEGGGRSTCFLLCTSPENHWDPSDHDSDSRKFTLGLPLAKGHDKTNTGKSRYNVLSPTDHKNKNRSKLGRVSEYKNKWFHERNNQNSLFCFNCDVSNKLKFDFRSDPCKKNSSNYMGQTR